MNLTAAQNVTYDISTHKKVFPWMSLPHPVNTSCLACNLFSPVPTLSSQEDWKLPERNNPVLEFSATYLVRELLCGLPKNLQDGPGSTVTHAPANPTTSLPHHHLHPGMKSQIVSAKNFPRNFCGWSFHTAHLTWLNNWADCGILQSEP